MVCEVGISSAPAKDIISASMRQDSENSNRYYFTKGEINLRLKSQQRLRVSGSTR
jgi:hypothetical protein